MKASILLAALALLVTGCTSIDGALPGLLVDDRGLARHDAAPLVEIHTPQDGDGVGLAVPLVGEARAASARVTDVQLRIDGGRWQSLAGVPKNVPVSAFTATIEVSPGDHVLELRAYDGEAFSLPARVTVRAGEPPPPTVRISSPEDGAGLRTGETRIEGTFTGEVARMLVRVGPRIYEGTVQPTLGRWFAVVDVPSGEHTVVAQGFGADASLPSTVRVAAAPVAPPRLAVAVPEPRASYGSAGDGTCAPDACIRFAGTTDASRVQVSLDAGEPIPVAAAGHAWTWQLPVAGLWAGEHVARFTPFGADGAAGVVQEARFLLRSDRNLDITGDEAPRLTSVPLAFRVEGDGVEDARWTLDGLEVGQGPSASFQLASPGDHRLVVEARDDRGAVASRVVPLFAINRAPTLAVDTGVALAALPTTFTARAEDADGRVVRYTWQFGSDEPESTSTPVARHSFARAGVHRVNVTAYDDHGAASATVSLLVPVLNAPPTADFSWSPLEPSIFDTVTFRDASLDPEGTPADLAWDIGGVTRMGNVTQHRFATRGNHTVTLRVADADGGVDVVSRTIHVRNLAPNVSFTLDPPAPYAGQEVLLRDASSKSDGLLVERRWSFSDGRETTGERVRHVFQAEGRHLVTLTVVDDLGARASSTLEVAVGAAPPNLTRVVLDPADPVAARDVRMQAVAFDREGNVSLVRWDFGDNATLECQGACPGQDGWVAVHRYARSGAYSARVEAISSSGLSTALSFIVRVANALPRGELSLDGRAYAGLPARLVASASDDDGRVTSLRFDADGNGVADCEGAAPICTVTYDRPGSYLALLDVEDDEGGRSTVTRILDVHEPPAGAAPPSITIRDPGPGTSLRGEVLLRGEARAPRPLTGVDVQLRNGSWSLAPSRTSWAPANLADDGVWSLVLATMNVPDGEYELVARALDADGTAGYARVPVRVANGEPEPQLVLRVENLAPGSQLLDDLLVRGTAYHPEGVHAVRYRLDGGAWSSALGDPFAWGIPLARLAPGNHTLDVLALHDLDEQEDVSIPFQVVSRAPPIVVDRAPASVVYGLLHVEGHLESLGQVLWRIDNDLWQELPPGRNWTLHEPTMGWPGGAHALRLKSVTLGGDAESAVVEIPLQIAKLRLEEPPPRPPSPPARAQTPGSSLALLAIVVLAVAFTCGDARRRL